MAKRILLVVLLALASGCSTQPERVETSSNAEASVALLTTWQDGVQTCKLWRINIDSRAVYVARCGAGLTAMEEHTVSTGKTSHTVRVEAQTIERE